jgi:hypothetical protein
MQRRMRQESIVPLPSPSPEALGIHQSPCSIALGSTAAGSEHARERLGAGRGEKGNRACRDEDEEDEREEDEGKRAVCEASGGRQSGK